MRINLLELIRESNRIEGIHRDPTLEEVRATADFISKPSITVEDVERLVHVYQPDARLRRRVGLNVRVGNHFPPLGGPEIEFKLGNILGRHNVGQNPWSVHVDYETLHPFTDGNGRSGRALWMHAMKDQPLIELGFLHSFYYQTLSMVGR